MNAVAKKVLFRTGTIGLAFAIAWCTSYAQVRKVDPSTLKALPMLLKSLQVNPASGAGATPVDGRVELHQAPGPNGVTVKLESSNPQLASVPAEVTITMGVSSAETGPMYIATFPVRTQPVQEDTTVVIKARSGTQILEANFRIKRPTLKSASMDPPAICDGNNKAKVTYQLTGPAPPGLKVSTHGNVMATTGSSVASTGWSGEGETVPTGSSTGSFRFALPRCPAHNPGQSCSIRGYTVVGSSAVAIGTSCGHPPD